MSKELSDNTEYLILRSELTVLPNFILADLLKRVDPKKEPLMYKAIKDSFQYWDKPQMNLVKSIIREGQ